MYSFPLISQRDTAFTFLYANWKSLIYISNKIFFSHIRIHFTITVQLLCDNADKIGFFTEPDAIIDLLTPNVNASVLANIFFSIPGPILGNNFLASFKVR